jgi:hypothetical protein
MQSSVGSRIKARDWGDTCNGVDSAEWHLLLGTLRETRV